MKENNSVFLKDLNAFQNYLKNQLNKRDFNPIECYLIHSALKNCLLNHFNDINYKNNSKKNYNLSYFSDINKYFIDNFKICLDFLKNGYQFIYASKNIMESFFNKEDLKKYHNISEIYVVNKKIIVDFQDNNCNKSILIINPFENFDKRNIFIIVFNINNFKEKKEIFKSLLSENINNLLDEEKLKDNYFNILYKFEDFLKIKNDNEINNNKSSYIINKNQGKEIKEVLQILILIYYYEKYLSKKNYVFSEYQTYYLINSEWMEIFKEYYYYKYLINILNENDLKNKDINFLKIDSYINSLTNEFYENYINFKIQIGLRKDLRNIDSLKATIFISNNLNYYNNCYIISSKIINRIIKFEFKVNPSSLIKPCKIIARNDKIFLLTDFRSINIGKLDENLLFQNKYILSYNSSSKYESEKNILLNSQMDLYIRENNCNEKSFDVQILKDKSNNIIGKLLILNEYNTSFNTNNNKLKINYISNNNNNLKYFNSIDIENNIKKIDEKNELEYDRNERTFQKHSKTYTDEFKNASLLTSKKRKYSNKSKDIELKEKIKELEENEKKYQETIAQKQKREIELICKLSNLDKILKSNEINISMKEKELKEKISSFEKQIEEKNNINKELFNKIKILEENKSIIEEKNKKEKELFEKISILERENKKIIEEKKNKEKEYINNIEELSQKNNEEITKLKERIELVEKYEKEYQNIKKENEKIVKLNESKEKEYLNKENNIASQKNELNLKALYIQKREEDLNNKMKNLEEKSNILEKEKNEFNSIKEEYKKYLEENKIKRQENINLQEKNKSLEEEIKNKEIILNKINLQIINNNNLNKKEEFQKADSETLINFINYNKLKKNNNKNIISIINNHENENNNNYKDNNKDYNKNNNVNNHIIINNNNNTIIMDNMNRKNNNINNIINNNISNLNNKSNTNNNSNSNIDNTNMNNSSNINNTIMNNNIILNNNNSNMINIPNCNMNNNISYNNFNINPFFNKQPLVGLNNIGASCYMNSTLQCLSQTFPLTNYFLDQNNEYFINNDNSKSNDIINLKLAPAYLELIKQLWLNQDGHTCFAPYFFKNTIGKLNPLFQNNEACDAKDLIIFIIEQMHKELKYPIKDSENNNQNVELNQYDRKNALLFFINSYKKMYSKISEIFYGFKETTNMCLNCKNVFNSQNMANPICYNYDLFNCLIFPLEEVKKMKYNNNIDNNNNFFIQNQNNINNIVTIYDCFEYNQRIDNFKGQNQSYCNICKQFSDSLFCSKIFSSPNILILILNRGKDNEYDVKLYFEETIDISNYILDKDIDMRNKLYNLYGIISHTGESGPSGHFIASCKSHIDGNWYRYNDALVGQIYDIQKEAIEFGTPYILFYQKQIYENNIFSKFQLN